MIIPPKKIKKLNYGDKNSTIYKLLMIVFKEPKEKPQNYKNNFLKNAKN
jgi:hypothetical protein